MRVERFSLFFPPIVARWRPRGGETEYAIGAIPLGGYVKISGMNPEEALAPEVAERAYFRQRVWKRIVVIAAGPLVNVALAFVILWVLILSQGRVQTGAIGVGRVQHGAPAAGVLKPGDRILSIDRTRGYAPGLATAQIDRRVDALRRAVDARRCAGRLVDGCAAARPARITVLRAGRTLRVAIRPRYDAGLGRMLLGFGYPERHVDVGSGEAASLSVTIMWELTTTTVQHVVRLFYDSAARHEVSGVVGSYEATRESFAFDTVRALYVLALISLSLGVINLFPFLPLDGGHIFWALAEKVRGRPIAFSVMERVGIVGFMLVLFLFFIGLQNDIGRLSSGEGFGVR